MAKILRLALVLGVFCIISAGLLAYVYLFTSPQILMNSKVSFERSKREVLPPGTKGRVIQVAPKGYAGPVEILVGIGKNGKVSGLKILSQKETPGLGSNAAKPEFLKQFIGKSLKDKIEAKQDIEAITGATITSRAVCRGVKEALTKAKGKR
ncbi:MAG: FMN-binding protein [bacterium]